MRDDRWDPERDDRRYRERDDRRDRDRDDRRDDRRRGDNRRERGRDDREEWGENNFKRKADTREDPFIKKKTGRWDTANIKSNLFPVFVIPKLEPSLLEALLLRIRIEELTYKLTTGQIDAHYISQEEPSEPVYDNMGKRVNTKEMMARERIKRERQKLIEIAFKIHPGFRPPPDYVPMRMKKSKKIYIPVQKYPNYNFIGLIIGPRGITQKEMEKETGTKISIRGKGSIKEGKKNEKPIPGEDEDLHVLITGDTEDQLTRASVLIEKLLIPVDEKMNDHKMRQLEKLAELNGTLKERKWTAPTGGNSAISCSICGEVSHPTSDCPMKGKPGVRNKLDQEYEMFLSEIGGEMRPGGPPPRAGQDGNNMGTPFDHYNAQAGPGNKNVSSLTPPPGGAHMPMHPPYGMMPMPPQMGSYMPPNGASPGGRQKEGDMSSDASSQQAGQPSGPNQQQMGYADPYGYGYYGYYPNYYDYSQYYWGGMPPVTGGSGTPTPSTTGQPQDTGNPSATGAHQHQLPQNTSAPSQQQIDPDMID